MADEPARGSTASFAAQALGITPIHQEPISFPDLSVAENFVLGRGDGALVGRVPSAAMRGDAEWLVGLLGLRST